MKRSNLCMFVVFILLGLMLLTSCSSSDVDPVVDDFGGITVSYMTKREIDASKEKVGATMQMLKENGLLDGKYGINVAMALFDFDLDGTPELLSFLDGGSSGSLYADIYDINTKQSIGTLYIGRFGSTSFKGSICVYVNAAGEYRVIEYGTTQSGLSHRYRTVGEYSYSKAKNELEYTGLFSSEHIDDRGLSLEEDINTKGYVDVKYKKDGVVVDHDDYYKEFEDFLNENTRLSNTGIVLIYWKDVEDDTAKMCDALFETEQSFIKK
ncbi:MAG: hypothetical protein E7675_07515 [Ruminococcaceae bacterium]|nr:hypothetical protein [Oscillospiraceae bacterium]